MKFKRDESRKIFCKTSTEENAQFKVVDSFGKQERRKKFSKISFVTTVRNFRSYNKVYYVALYYKFFYHITENYFLINISQFHVYVLIVIYLS